MNIGAVVRNMVALKEYRGQCRKLCNATAVGAHRHHHHRHPSYTNRISVAYQVQAAVPKAREGRTAPDSLTASR